MKLAENIQRLRKAAGWTPVSYTHLELMAEQTIFPDEGAQDGFYIAKMTRRG